LLEGVLTVVSVVAVELSPTIEGVPVRRASAAGHVSGAHAAGVQAAPGTEIPPAAAHADAERIEHGLPPQQALGQALGVHEDAVDHDPPPAVHVACVTSVHDALVQHRPAQRLGEQPPPSKNDPPQADCVVTVHEPPEQHRPLGLQGLPEQLTPDPCQSPPAVLHAESVRSEHEVPTQHAPVWAGAHRHGSSRGSSAIKAAMPGGRRRMVARVNMSNRLSRLKTANRDTARSSRTLRHGAAEATEEGREMPRMRADRKNAGLSRGLRGVLPPIRVNQPPESCPSRVFPSRVFLRLSVSPW
jgi:hypothetical protein